ARAPRPQSSTLFPYTTLFRSRALGLPLGPPALGRLLLGRGLRLGLRLGRSGRAGLLAALAAAAAAPALRLRGVAVGCRRALGGGRRNRYGLGCCDGSGGRCGRRLGAAGGLPASEPG